MGLKYEPASETLPQALSTLLRKLTSEYQYWERELIDYKTSMTTYEDPLRGFGGN